jgi:Ni,Fe-hydrogenase III small subunit
MTVQTLPARYRVASRAAETHDTVTLGLEPVDQPIGPYLPGQFTMLYAFGVGEVPISISGPAGRGLTHTIRSVGAVTRTLLDCQGELLALAAEVDIVHFTEATSTDEAGPYDVSLVEGSVTTQQDAERIQRIRAQSRTLVTIGACATSGGIQALRNFADVADFAAVVYARPEYVHTLATSTARSSACPSRPASEARSAAPSPSTRASPAAASVRSPRCVMSTLPTRADAGTARHHP